MGQVVAAIVIAAGRGVRAGGSQPKQYRDIQGVPVIRVALAAFADHSGVHLVQPVINLDDLAQYRTAAGGLAVLEPVAGITAIGSGGNYALSAARALAEYEPDAETLARKAMAAGR